VKRKICLSIAAFFLIITIVSAQSIGSIVTIDQSFLGTTKQAYDKIVKLCVAKDSVGITELIYNGYCFIVEDGTRAKVIDSTVLCVEVRILSGKQEGKSGWISRDLVKK
jgi:hypothetical protein